MFYQPHPPQPQQPPSPTTIGEEAASEAAETKARAEVTEAVKEVASSYFFFTVRSVLKCSRVIVLSSSEILLLLVFPVVSDYLIFQVL